MNRAHWQNLAEERVLDADVLLQAGRWAGAFHLIGYAVESGLKSCVLAYMENGTADVIFRERKFSDNCWTHNIEELVRLAGLRSALDLDITLAPKKHILTRRASEGSASEPSLARRVSMCKDAKLSCRGNMAANRQLGINWIYATQWKEISRYQTATEFNARRLYQAVADAADGVLPWVRTRW